MVKNGVEYSELELEILKEYIEEIETEVNNYLLSGEIPVAIETDKKLKDFLHKVEVLYGIGCKYGAGHDIPEENNNESKKVPFVNFNDLFDREFVSDETGLLILPEYNNSETISDFNNDISDAELKLIVYYNNKQELTKTEKEVFEKLTKKMKNYTMFRFKKIQKIYMEKPLVIGNYVTKLCVDKYPGLMKKEPNFETIITLGEIKNSIKSEENTLIGWGVPSLLQEDYSRRPSYLQTSKYNVIKGKTISLDIVFEILDYNHKTGNYKYIKEIADKGLIIDDVIASEDVDPKDLPEDDEVEEVAIIEVEPTVNLIVYKEPWFKKLFKLLKAKFNEEI